MISPALDVLKQQLRWVILDRDGVINEDSDAYVKSPSEWQAIPGSLEAIARLNHAGLKVAIATNQSGIGRGYYSETTLVAIHQKMHQQLTAVGGVIAQLLYCPHLPGDQCNCRKPKPGMLMEILTRQNLPYEQACFIGDSPSDYQAAQAAGLAFYGVKTGKGQSALDKQQFPSTVVMYESLSDWTEQLLCH